MKYADQITKREIMINHRPRKRFGQHFLIDINVIENLVNGINPNIQDNIVEIGPGLGALTKYLLPHLTCLQAIELDKDIIPKLCAVCDKLGDLQIHCADVLLFDFKQLFSSNKKLRIVGNLPYNISSPLLFRLMEQKEIIKDMHFMLQKEVVDRITAKPKTKAYGRFSIIMQYYCYVETLFVVSPTAFRPQPKVTSAVLRLIPYSKPPFVAKNECLLKKILNQAFSHRRKVLRNNLKNVITTKQFLQAGVDPCCRAEQLSVADYVNLCNLIA